MIKSFIPSIFNKNFSYYSGAIPSSLDSRDKLFENTKIAKSSIIKKFPDSYKSEYPLFVYNQGTSNMCVPCSIALIRYIQTYLQTGKALTFDPLFIYAARTEKMYQGEGMSPRDAMSIAKNKGITTTNKLIYCSYPESLIYFKKHEDEFYKEAEKYKINTYYSIKNTNDIKTAIMKLGAVSVMIPHYECLDKPNYVNNRAYINYSVFDKITKFKGYHEVTIVGWHRSYWLVINSWGRDYGIDGMIHLPIDYPLIECWTCIDDYNETE